MEGDTGEEEGELLPDFAGEGGFWAGGESQYSVLEAVLGSIR